MIPLLRTLTSALLFLVLSQVVFAQKGDLTIDGSSVAGSAVPGQLIEVFVAGISSQFGHTIAHDRIPVEPPIPLDRFQVLVTQDGVTRRAKVRAAALVLLRARSTGSSPAERVRTVGELVAGAKTYQFVMFTAPLDLHEGHAGVVVKYDGRRSNEFKFEVANRLPAPWIGLSQVATTSSQRTPPNPDDLKRGAKRGFGLVRGRDIEITVSPLMDPEVPDSGVIVTFKQGNLSRDVNAKVIRRGGAESRDSTEQYAPLRYQVTVHAPEELELGAAHIEVRLKLRGQLSEPALAEVLIADSSGSVGRADLLKPYVTSLGAQRIGIGQTVKVSVDAKWLEPDPSKTLIVLEQGSKRIELRPEVNTATLVARLSERMPAVLIARVKGGDLIGKVNLRVYNPGKGERDGLSEGLPIEIVAEVVPPLGIKVSEGAKQDIARLQALREEALKRGREFHEYDPKARYVTIQAIGLDYNRRYVRVKFEQGGRQFLLKDEDISLIIDDRLIVRVPDTIKPGSVQVTIQNSNGDRLSDPVITTVEITSPAN